MALPKGFDPDKSIAENRALLEPPPAARTNRVPGLDTELNFPMLGESIEQVGKFAGRTAKNVAMSIKEHPVYSAGYLGASMLDPPLAIAGGSALAYLEGKDLPLDRPADPSVSQYGLPGTDPDWGRSTQRALTAIGTGLTMGAFKIPTMAKRVIASAAVAAGTAAILPGTPAERLERAGEAGVAAAGFGALGDRVASRYETKPHIVGPGAESQLYFGFLDEVQRYRSLVSEAAPPEAPPKPIEHAEFPFTKTEEMLKTLPGSIPSVPLDPAGNTKAVIFASPNVREAMTQPEAEGATLSRQHALARGLIRDINEKLGLSGVTVDAIGTWPGESNVEGENSLMSIVRGADPATVRYAAAQQGLLLNQKEVIPFVANGKGPFAVHTLNVPAQNVDQVLTALDRAGIPGRTVGVVTAPDGGFHVAVYDGFLTDPAARAKLHVDVTALGLQYGIQPETVLGNEAGEPLSGGTRAEARQSYQHEILNYESAHPERPRYRVGSFGVPLPAVTEEVLPTLTAKTIDGEVIDPAPGSATAARSAPPPEGTPAYDKWYGDLTTSEQQRVLDARGVKLKAEQVDDARMINEVNGGGGGGDDIVTALGGNDGSPGDGAGKQLVVERMPGFWKTGGRWLNAQVAPVNFVARRHPAAEMIAASARNATRLREGYSMRVKALVHDIYRGLTYEQKKQVVEMSNRSVDASQLAQQPEEVQRAYRRTRSFLAGAKKYVETNKLADTGRWSIPDDEYFPHIFVGSYQIMDGARTIDGGFATTVGEALDKAAQHLKINPKADIRIAPREIRNEYTATMLSRPGFYKLVGNIERATTMDKGEILDLMKGVAAIKPRPKFVGNFQQRLADLGGFVDDPEKALAIYSDRIIRKRFLDPFRKQATDLARELPPDLNSYFTEFIHDVGTGYDPWDSNYAVRSGLRRAMQIQNVLKIGYNPRIAIAHRLQPLLTSAPEIGGYLQKGKTLVGTGVEHRLMNEAALQASPTETLIGNAEHMKGMGSLLKPGTMFQEAMFRARREVLDGAYLYANEKLNLSPEASRQFAIDHMDASMYLYNVSNAPRFLRRTAFGRFVGQFKAFHINQMYRIADLLHVVATDKPLFSNAARGLTFSERAGMGTRLLATSIGMYGLAALPLAARTGTLAYVFANHPYLAHGIMGMLGMDMSNQTALDPSGVVPSHVTDILGVNAAEFARLWKLAQDHDMGAYLRGASPSVSNVIAAYTGTLRGARGSLVTRLSPAERIATAFGETPIRVSRERSAMTAMRSDYFGTRSPEDEDGLYQRAHKQFIDRLVEARRNGDVQAYHDAYREAMRAGIVIAPTAIQDAVNMGTEPALVRMYRKLPPELKKKYAPLVKELEPDAQIGITAQEEQ